jgi:hypothetical protein
VHTLCAGEADPFNYLDVKNNYGSTAQQQGRIKWTVRKRMFRDRGISSSQSCPPVYEHADVTGEVHVCFKYFDGVTGVIRAVSVPITIVFGRSPPPAAPSAAALPPPPAATFVSGSSAATVPPPTEHNISVDTPVLNNTHQIAVTGTLETFVRPS